jgi:hypothetical protein
MPSTDQSEQPTTQFEIDYLLGDNVQHVGAPASLLPFTKNMESRKRAKEVAIAMIDRLHQLQPFYPLEPIIRLTLVRKLLTHLNRAGLQSPNAISDFRSDAIAAAEIVADDPSLIFAPINFAGILRRKPAPPPSPLNFPPDTPPRPVIWRYPDNIHRLEELTHPCHLLLEGHFLQHCIAREYDQRLLKFAKFRPGTPAGATCLVYWQYVEDGRSRLFSLADAKRPRVTLHIDLKHKLLCECGARSDITGKEPFFNALIEAIVFLANHCAPLKLGRPIFLNEEIIAALTKRVSEHAKRKYLYPNQPMQLT